MIARLRFLSLICVLCFPILVRAQGMTTAGIDQALGRSGQKTGDVYRVSFPRTDLHVSIGGLAIKPGLALGSWAAFTGTDDNAMVMGDLVQRFNGAARREFVLSVELGINNFRIQFSHGEKPRMQFLILGIFWLAEHKLT